MSGERKLPGRRAERRPRPARPARGTRAEARRGGGTRARRDADAPVGDETPAYGLDLTPEGSGSRRRVAEPRERQVNPVMLLSFVIPLVTVGALATVHPAPTEEPDRAPSDAALTNAVVVCPAAPDGPTEAMLALADEQASGPLRVTGTKDAATIEADRVTTVRAKGALVVRGDGPTAVGLLAARNGSDAGTACSAPRSETWFTGVGAGPEHASRLRLVNPDAGPAVADVTVLTATGERQVQDLRGLAVAGGSETVVDLAEEVPEAKDVSVRVVVNRGRLVPSVNDTVTEIGGRGTARGWLNPQDDPATTNHLLGVRRGGGKRVLAVANGGPDETRVQVRAVTASSEFAPSGIEELRVPGGSTATLDLSKFLASSDAGDVVGLRIDSDDPVTASLRTVRGGQLTQTAGAPALERSAAALVGSGGSTLLLGGVQKVTDVTVRQRTGKGESLQERVVKVSPGTAEQVELSDRARVVVLEFGDVGLRAAVTTGRDSAQVRVLEELATVSLVPHVRPALK